MVCLAGRLVQNGSTRGQRFGQAVAVLRAGVPDDKAGGSMLVVRDALRKKESFEKSEI